MNKSKITTHAYIFTATYAYQKMCSADAYIDTVLDITSHMGKFARYSRQLSGMFSKPDCMVRKQTLSFSDYSQMLFHFY